MNRNPGRVPARPETPAIPLPPQCELVRPDPIRRARGQWSALLPCFEDGRIELDNNPVENAIRPTKLGAKNWLFIGREDTGWRSAVVYTFVENIRRAGCDPYAYLKWLFERLPGMTN